MRKQSEKIINRKEKTAHLEERSSYLWVQRCWLMAAKGTLHWHRQKYDVISRVDQKNATALTASRCPCREPWGRIEVVKAGKQSRCVATFPNTDTAKWIEFWPYRTTTRQFQSELTMHKFRKKYLGHAPTMEITYPSRPRRKCLWVAFDDQTFQVLF